LIIFGGVKIMKFSKRGVNKVMIVASILLVTGTVIVCIIGERRFRENKYKKYSGATEVNAIYIGEEYEN
jgi:undecaprenyl pyrophosphate phosphatase UppP